MSVAQRGGLRPIDAAAPVVAPSTLAPRLVAVGKGIGLVIGALAVVGIIEGVVRTNLIVILVSWSLLSVAVTALHALSRAGGRR